MPKILIAEDNVALRSVWAVNLRARGYKVAEATDGQQCLELFDAENPDSVVLDLGMPVMSGWEVLELLSARPAPPPVIVVTGLEDGRTRERALALGAAYVLFKPFGIERLLAALEAVLK